MAGMVGELRSWIMKDPSTLCNFWTLKSVWNPLKSASWHWTWWPSLLTAMDNSQVQLAHIRLGQRCWCSCWLQPTSSVACVSTCPGEIRMVGLLAWEVLVAQPKGRSFLHISPKHPKLYHKLSMDPLSRGIFQERFTLLPVCRAGDMPGHPGGPQPTCGQWHP